MASRSKKLAPKRPRRNVDASSSAPQPEPPVAPAVPGLHGIPSDASLMLVDGTFQQVIPPRFVSFRSFESVFPEMLSLFEAQGWVDFVSVYKTRCNPALCEMFNNLAVDEYTRDIYTTVRGVEICLSAELLSLAFGGLRQTGKSVHVVTSRVSNKRFFKTLTLKEPTDADLVRRLNASDLPPMHRMIHHFISSIIYPKAGDRMHINEVEKKILYLMLKKKQMDLPILMTEMFRECHSNPKRSIPYGCHQTALLSYCRVPMSERELKNLLPVSVYDISSLSKMRFEVSEGNVIRSTKRQKMKGVAPPEQSNPEEPVDLDSDSDGEHPFAQMDLNQEAGPSSRPTSSNTEWQTSFSAKLDDIHSKVQENYKHTVSGMYYRFDNLEKMFSSRIDDFEQAVLARLNRMEEKQNKLISEVDVIRNRVQEIHDYTFPLA